MKITWDIFVKFIKFGVVGFSGLVIDFGITILLKEKLNVQKYLANASGFIAAASSNYFLNRVWTFESKSTQIAMEYTEFIIISLIGLGINSLVLWLMINKFNFRFYSSKFIAIMVTTFWNFIANLLYTFN